MREPIPTPESAPFGVASTGDCPPPTGVVRQAVPASEASSAPQAIEDRATFGSGPWGIAAGVSLLVALLVAVLWRRSAHRWRVETSALQAQLKHLERETEQAQALQAVGQVTLGVAHDFNNLLTAIVGYADLALLKLDSDESDASTHAELVEIRKISQSASDLVRELLRSSRNHEKRSEAIDLDAHLRDLSGRIASLVGAAIAFRLDTGAERALVSMTSARLDQVVLNLVLNARDAMNESGALFVETSRGHRRAERANDEFVRLRVRDNGHGMTDEVRQHVFEPFFSTKAEGEGSGLGLATVHTIVRAAGGHVVVASSPGAGATFDVYLPCTSRPAEVVGQPQLAARR